MKLKKYALISVSDKNRIEVLADFLSENGYTILATGKTYSLLQTNNIPVTEVSGFTGFPEIFGGRVKTLNPLVMGSILFRRFHHEDPAEAEKQNMVDLDVVCVNLYSFQKVAANPDSTTDELIENIDIGGPSLIRAAAKNHHSVSVLTSPDQYDDFISRFMDKRVDTVYRQELAVRAFEMTANYDVAISNTLAGKLRVEKSYISYSSPIVSRLRYGENPHQNAYLSGDFYKYFEKIHGKELSFNNILDINAAFEICREFERPSAVIIKHNNPSGAAVSDSLKAAYLGALACDPVAAFGGIVAFNAEVNDELAVVLNEIFLEVILAPSFSEKALEILKKKKDRRLLIINNMDYKTESNIRSIPGGFLTQDEDSIEDDFVNLKVVTSKAPSTDEENDLKFAWAIARYAKSNSIVFVKEGRTIGIGAGQVSRVDAVKVAVMKAKQLGLSLEGSVVASDAFFPFSDGLVECVNAGAAAFIQPGGSVRDDEVIRTANELKVSMVFTGKRHFKH
ncbi:MAG: bifunctional phosphoribosylaminoimidazolecarboxamide formyltransferase/IMP cyclohydrolase [Ignavibacteriaceae bacterium]|nr:bifunctional phosphoribosylaminoimidazolecarboxamide formyltransferase/IMP cyclohydrolase [Ignavibacteriaceae bacterium]